ncbi:hypothetical protein [Micromonospora sp. DH14]|uniref:hypothetical protein n=1 Tax=Micromonospora sp. DH14 TaxID=3040120 RepID=UPI002442C81C|nr:hypothetical protein [Micromonospora sp. DH14]MDG9673125.1 hypothetical protein [Micromonospora sp. DH14]
MDALPAELLAAYSISRWMIDATVSARRRGAVHSFQDPHKFGDVAASGALEAATSEKLCGS